MSRDLPKIDYLPLADFALPTESQPDWFDTAELRELDRFALPAKRQQWLAGRFLAKRLVQRACQEHAGRSLDLREIHVQSRSEQGLGVQPIVIVAGQQLGVSLSIAHSQRGVVAALDASGAGRVGVDLVELENCAAARPAFQRLWFSQAERAWADGNPWRAASVWALKESIYKAANRGESWMPLHIEVRPGSSDDSWNCKYRGLPLPDATIHLQNIDVQILAVACLPKIPTTTSALAQRAFEGEYFADFANGVAPVLELSAAWPSDLD